MAASPNIAFIDDREDYLRPFAASVKESGASKSEIYHPSDVTLDILRESHLIVVDYALGEWIEHAEVQDDQICLKPINGVALCAVLREHTLSLKKASPTGFALISGERDILGVMKGERRPHVVSRLGNLEWFFERDKPQPDRLVQLASAIASLPTKVSDICENIEGLMEFLGASNHQLKERLLRSVQKCRPPINHMSECSQGLMIIRWLLHRVLPHNTCLMNDLHLAARLYITPLSVSKLLDNSEEFRNLFNEMLYKGPLSSFDGHRWWRDGIEQLLWDGTEGKSSSRDSIFEYLTKAGVAGFEPITLSMPVVTVDNELNSESSLSEFSDVVTLHLDDWPSYAEPAYARREEVETHAEMKMYVVDDE